MSSSHTVLKYLRLIHLCIGVFIAPALLFFAFTGALQTFSLHETTRGSSVSIGLFVSTLSGLYMSYKYIRNRQLITVILLAGIIVPVLLTVF